MQLTIESESVIQAQIVALNCMKISKVTTKLHQVRVHYLKFCKTSAKIKIIKDSNNRQLISRFTEDGAVLLSTNLRTLVAHLCLFP